jgi:transcriptional regulator with XRE-family HTH domain
MNIGYPKTKFGTLIRQFRHNNKPPLRLEDLAKKIGKSVSYISRFENGKMSQLNMDKGTKDICNAMGRVVKIYDHTVIVLPKSSISFITCSQRMTNPNWIELFEKIPISLDQAFFYLTEDQKLTHAESSVIIGFVTNHPIEAHATLKAHAHLTDDEWAELVEQAEKIKEKEKW